MERELCRQCRTQNYPARYNSTTKGQYDFRMDKDRYFSKKYMQMASTVKEKMFNICQSVPAALTEYY